MENKTNKREFGGCNLKKDKSPEIISGLEVYGVAAVAIKFSKTEKGKKMMVDSAKSVAKVIKKL